MTGGLSDDQLRDLHDRFTYFTELNDRQQVILKSIEEQGKLTPELQKIISSCENKTELEDLYLPFKPRRRTKATVAREKGLEPLAILILEQQTSNLFQNALSFVNKELDVNSPDEALQGARDIISEIISEDAVVREGMRVLFKNSAIVKTKVIIKTNRKQG